MNIIAVGGSLGGFKAFKKLITPLPVSIPYPIVYVFHQKVDSTKHVKELQKVTEIPVVQIEDGMEIQKGKIYLSPADRHTIVQKGNKFAVLITEPINYTRPSVDLFFASVADVFSKKALVIVLSGGNKDGAAGARKVAGQRGFVWVQSPSLAFAKRMPTTAIESVPTANSMAPYQMADRLKDLNYEDFILRSEKLLK